MELFCTTIIPTIGRASLTRAIASVLTQTFTLAGQEVIVVNDTGRPLPPAIWDDTPWAHDPRVRLITTNRRERSIARNTGAAVALAPYLHFLDDDDWLLPGAMQAFWQVTQAHPTAAWLYGVSQLVDRQGRPLIQLRHGIQGNGFWHTMVGEWLPLQSSLIAARHFFAVGGFHPLVPATQDVDLSRRICLQGDVAETTVVVACIGMGQEGSATDRVRGPAYSRWAREQILAQGGVYARLADGWAGSGRQRGEWYGRMARIYLTSAVWNGQQRRLWTAVSRLMWAGRSVVAGGTAVARPTFWRAIRQAYASDTFQRGWDAAPQQPGQEAIGPTNKDDR